MVIQSESTTVGSEVHTDFEESAGSDSMTPSQIGMADAEDGEKRNLKWWQETNAYEIDVKSFKDSDGDGVGDINGVTEELDYLKSLGVGVIWLSPVYYSPQKDNGYDIADYYQIDKMYGSMEDMENLIAQANERGIRIVMDLVFNHTSNENQWFIESKVSKDNGKSDWYIWRDAAEDGGAPTNWRSIFGGSAWTWCEERQQYYLHTFLEEQPDLNWENPEVRQALYDVANFWLDKGVGGFRMDAVTYIKKPRIFEDGTPDAEDGMVGIHGETANTEGILDFLHEFKENVEEGHDIFTVGEANGVKSSQLPLWVGSNGVFDMIFGFDHITIDLPDETNWAETREYPLTELKGILSANEETTMQDGWCPVFFENHDQSRSINHFMPDCNDPVKAGKVLGTVLLTMRGTPFIYQGEELGLTNVKWDSIEDYNDISTKRHFEFLLEEGYSEEESMEAVHRYSRDNARTPMQWSKEENAGFTIGTPWLPVSENYREYNVETESAQDGSVLSWYRKLAELKQTHRELIDGGYEEILPESEQIFGYVRDNGSSKATILVNFSGENAEYDASLTEGSEVLLCSYGDQGQEGTLRPYEAILFSNAAEDQAK